MVDQLLQFWYKLLSMLSRYAIVGVLSLDQLLIIPCISNEFSHANVSKQPFILFFTWLRLKYPVFLTSYDPLYEGEFWIRTVKYVQNNLLTVFFLSFIERVEQGRVFSLKLFIIIWYSFYGALMLIVNNLVETFHF